jgi:DNA polymerase III delta subunit
MATDNAIPFLRNLSGHRRLPFAISIAGPQAFLREAVFASIRDVLAGSQLDYRAFQVGAGDSFAELLNELMTPGLFFKASFIFCRVLKSRRDKSADLETDGDERGEPKAEDQALADAIEKMTGPSYLVMLYDRDVVPAKIRRAIERSGLSITCNRPFDNQIADCARVFAKRLGLKLTPAALDFVVNRYASDLAAISNAFDKAAITCADTGRIDVDDLLGSGRARAPELFDLAESLALGKANEVVWLIDRAIELGRDPFELLAVEVIPALRRMLVAAAMLSKRRPDGAIARSFGMSPFSPLAARAIEGARGYGLAALTRAYRAASDLDAGFKLGEIKNHHQAIAHLVLELIASRDALPTRQSPDSAR